MFMTDKRQHQMSKSYEANFSLMDLITISISIDQSMIMHIIFHNMPYNKCMRTFNLDELHIYVYVILEYMIGIKHKVKLPHRH